MDAFNDGPRDAPSPRTLADRCMARAWDDDTDDGSRLLLEQAALAITRLCGRLVDLAAAHERSEARGRDA